MPSIWAQVAVPYAGNNFGAFFIPDVGSEVLIAFVAGDPGSPIVIGNMWNGSTGLPESLPADTVDSLDADRQERDQDRDHRGEPGQERLQIQLPSGAVGANPH